MKNKDYTQRFLIENRDVRGELVRLEDSYKAILDTHFYPAPVQIILGELIAAVTALSGSLKYDGLLSLQTSSQGDIPYMMAECTSQRDIRAIAKVSEHATIKDIDAVLTEGTLGITIIPEKGNRYQGIVSLTGEKLADCLGTYFQKSEQLPTQIWLQCDGNQASALLLQALPEATKQGTSRRTENWQHVSCLAATLGKQEILTTSNETLLRRLFHEEDVRLFEANSVQFACSCSQQRSEQTLRALGEQQARDLLLEKGSIDINCEFCHQEYRFDESSVNSLFGGDETPNLH